ncbi:MAG: 4Fe-4S binding protein [Eubacteriaceae bacterium]
MKQKTRKIIIFISFLLFPITMNFLSPYVCIDGAMNGIISGSLILFAFMFIFGIFFGRAWCAWVCPMAALSEYSVGINNKKVNVKLLKIIRYSIFILWAGFIIAMFVFAGGVKGVNPLHLADNFISVDSPVKYIIYYFVLLLFAVLTWSIGKRGACHAVCWMAPFLSGGYHLGRILKIPQLRIKTDNEKCANCKTCDKICQMSINVSQGVKDGYINTSDCILCGQCIEACGKGALSYGIKSIKNIELNKKTLDI